MAVTIVFRGVMLFNMGDAQKRRMLTEVLLPDCTICPPCGTHVGDEFAHLDGTIAKRHYPMIMVAQKGCEPARYSIGGNCEVMVGSGNTQALSSSSACLALPASSSLGVGNLRLRPAAPRAARIRFAKLDCAKNPVSALNQELNFEVGQQQCLCHGISIELNRAPRITVQRTKQPAASIPVPEGSTVYILNSDVPLPTVPDIDEPIATKAPFIIDHDFKWIYSLLEHGKATELDEWACGYLPAPMWTHKEGKRAVSVSTCFPLWI